MSLILIKIFIKLYVLINKKKNKKKDIVYTYPPELEGNNPDVDFGAGVVAKPKI
jgi:hypothetical protein